MVFLNDNGIYEIKDIKNSILMEFINNIADYSYNVRREVITKTNKYLKYLYEEKITTADLSAIIRMPKFIHRPKLPVHYSKEEVEQIVNTINRATPEGKRDYAIILLAARLGLRCSDILNLSFSNLHWDKSLITICQFKTKQMVDLLLLPDIGNAIIDYLKFGRPISDSKKVFLRHTFPFEGMAKNHLYRISKYHIISSGIRHDNSKHGLQCS